MIGLLHRIAKIAQHLGALGWLDAAPKTVAIANICCVKRDWRDTRKMLGLNGIKRLRQVVRHPLKYRGAAQDKMAVLWIIRVPGFVDVEEVHKKGG